MNTLSLITFGLLQFAAFAAPHCNVLCTDNYYGGGEIRGTRPLCGASCDDCHGSKCYGVVGDQEFNQCWSGNLVCCCEYGYQKYKPVEPVKPTIKQIMTGEGSWELLTSSNKGITYKYVVGVTDTTGKTTTWSDTQGYEMGASFTVGLKIDGGGEFGETLTYKQSNTHTITTSITETQARSETAGQDVPCPDKANSLESLWQFIVKTKVADGSAGPTFRTPKYLCVYGNEKPICVPDNCRNEQCTKCCVDENKWCSAWAQGGECQKNPAWMPVHCKQACGCVMDGGVEGAGDEEIVKDTSCGYRGKIRKAALQMEIPDITDACACKDACSLKKTNGFKFKIRPAESDRRVQKSPGKCVCVSHFSGTKKKENSKYVIGFTHA